MVAVSGRAGRYLQAVFEIAEEGSAPTRTEIARRLERQGPTVTEATRRLEDSGLIRVVGRRRVQLTDTGGAVALAVVRKHRLLECFLAGVVGLDWTLVHREALAWQSVVSLAVERRIAERLGLPSRSPYGCAIPGVPQLLHGEPLDGLARSLVPAWTAAVEPRVPPRPTGPDQSLRAAARAAAERELTVARLAEPLQGDAAALRTLHELRLGPGSVVTVLGPTTGETVALRLPSGRVVELDGGVAAGVFVTRERTPRPPAAPRRAIQLLHD